MANTAKLKIVTKYMIEDLSNKYETKLRTRKVPVGEKQIMKEFSAVSDDGEIIISICHNSGTTSGGNIPIGKLNSIFAKCFLLEKTTASQKMIYFTNEEFYKIFKVKSDGLLNGIDLRGYANLNDEMKSILDEVYSASSKEMSR